MRTELCPLYRAALKFPQSPAIISTHHPISYEDLNHRVAQLQIYLHKKGIKVGDHVAIIDHNSPEYVAVLFALWRMGAVACLLNPRTPSTERKKVLARLNCVKVINLNKIPKNIFKKTVLNQPATISPNKPATIILTSGSSGEPKAVVHSLNNHIFNALGSNQNIRLKAGDAWLLALPLYHVSGLGIVFRSILAGTAITFLPIEEALRQNKATHVSLVTTQLFRLLKSVPMTKYLSRLKAILLGGSSIAPNLLISARKHKLPIYISYGLTEMASQVATSQSKSLKAKVLPHRQIKIARTGKIFVKGKTLFLGYYKNGRIPKKLQGGWFATGDLGKLTKKNVLTVTGRKDNMFISGGENIQPEEIEKALLSNPLIEKAVVVSHPDKEFGELPVAFIKSLKTLSRQSIERHLAKHLARFKIPRKFFAWPQEETTALKINRQHFQQLILTNQLHLKQLL